MINAKKNSFEIADRKIGALLDRFADQRVCPCCAARVLLLHGAALMENMRGSAEGIAACERIINCLRKNNLPAPPNQAGAMH